MTKEYIIENFTANISVDEYISRFRDEKRFVEFCKQCPNYGNSWGCPPFDFDTGEFLRQYEYAHLMATKIIPVEKNIPIDRTQELIKPERLRIERELLEMEHRYGGRAFAYVGNAYTVPIPNAPANATVLACIRTKYVPRLKHSGSI